MNMVTIMQICKGDMSFICLSIMLRVFQITFLFLSRFSITPIVSP